MSLQAVPSVQTRAPGGVEVACEGADVEPSGDIQEERLTGPGCGARG